MPRKKKSISRAKAAHAGRQQAAKTKVSYSKKYRGVGERGSTKYKANVAAGQPDFPRKRAEATKRNRKEASRPAKRRKRAL